MLGTSLAVGLGVVVFPRLDGVYLRRSSLRTKHGGMNTHLYTEETTPMNPGKALSKALLLTEVFRERIANISSLRRRGRPLRGSRPHDVICHTRTRNAAGADTTAAFSTNRRVDAPSN